MSKYKNNDFLEFAEFNKSSIKFLSRYKSASKDFLDQIFGLGEMSVRNLKTVKFPIKIKDALFSVDQRLLLDRLEKNDCPLWLGLWAMKEGGKNHQVAYLFSPNSMDENSIEERVSLRPLEIKKQYWFSRSPLIMSLLMNYDDETYLAWAREIGCDAEIQNSDLSNPDGGFYRGTVRAQIIDWFGQTYEPIISQLWEKYVPKKGECTILQGELARCIGRLQNELWRNGMMNMGDGYYDAMVDLIKKTIMDDDGFSPLVKRVVTIDAAIVKGADYTKLINTNLLVCSDVEHSLERLQYVVAAWCRKNSEPIGYNRGEDVVDRLHY